MNLRLQKIILIVDELWLVLKQRDGEEKANEITCSLYKWVLQEILKDAADSI